MGDAQFQTLLDALPQIEESVSKFQSEAVQQQVIEGLLAALLGTSEAEDTPDVDQETATPPERPEDEGGVEETSAPPSGEKGLS